MTKRILVTLFFFATTHLFESSSLAQSFPTLVPDRGFGNQGTVEIEGGSYRQPLGKQILFDGSELYISTVHRYSNARIVRLNASTGKVQPFGFDNNGQIQNFFEFNGENLSTNGYRPYSMGISGTDLFVMGSVNANSFVASLHKKTGALNTQFADNGILSMPAQGLFVETMSGSFISNGNLVVLRSLLTGKPELSAQSQLIVLDAQNGSERYNTKSAPSESLYISKTFQDEKGRFYLTGARWANFSEKGFASVSIHRYLPDGRVDASFGDEGVLILRTDDKRIETLELSMLYPKILNRQLVLTVNYGDLGYPHNILAPKTGIVVIPENGKGVTALRFRKVLDIASPSIDIDKKTGQVYLMGRRNNQLVVTRLNSNWNFDTRFAHKGFYTLRNSTDEKRYRGHLGINGNKLYLTTESAFGGNPMTFLSSFKLIR